MRFYREGIIMKEFKVERKVQKYGQRALCIVLPKIWTNAENITKGSKIIVRISYDGYLVMEKKVSK